MSLRRPLTIPKRAHPAVKLLYRGLNEEDMPPSECERLSGNGKGVIQSWRTERQPTLDNITAALNVVGYRLCFKKIDYDEAGNEIVPVKTATNSKPVPDPSWQILC